MPEYRRVHIEGGTYFFTAVTYKRRPLFADQITRDLYFSAIRNIQVNHPFNQIAYCILPDHIHCIWTLPNNDYNYSMRWKLIKCKFSKFFQYQFGHVASTNESRNKRGEVAVWQRRYWEHTIFDDDDLYNHIDYIHYNPVKHKYVSDPYEWPWTSLLNYYNPDSTSSNLSKKENLIILPLSV